jgi:nitrogenase molybdenum-iron protein beta chain
MALPLQDSVLTVLTEPQAETSNTIEQVRYACSLGALTSVLAIPGATPITHCGPGCAAKQFGSLATINGYQGGDFYVASTNLTSEEVVFGGTERLDELVDATRKIMTSDLYVVLTGCVPELVGDDVDHVVSKYRKLGIPIVFAQTSGFQGNNFTGHELVARAIIDQYVGDYEGPREKGTVNVWSVLPFQNTFWRGDLHEIKRVLEGIGLKVNILFGTYSKGVSEWKSIPQAEFNLVLSPWLGLEVAQHLEKKYNQPYLHYPEIPIGAKQTGKFLREVASFAGLDTKRVESFIASEEREYYAYLRDFGTFYNGYVCQYQLPTHAVVVSESAYNLSISRFLESQLGIQPVLHIITENPPEQHRALIREQFTKGTKEKEPRVEFVVDGYYVLGLASEIDFSHQFPIVFGSTWEGELAKKLKASLIEIAYPTTDEVVLSRSYVGYRGALQLLERTFTTVVRANTIAEG